MKLNLPKTRVARGLSALLLVVLGCAFYGLVIEPNWIEVTHHTVAAPIARPLKVAHLTDLHTSGLHFRERRLLALIDREQPDVIVITGDTVPPSGSYRAEARLLGSLHAPLGVWLVRGNWENWYPLRGEVEYYRANGVHFLLNHSAEIRPGIWLVGFNDTAFSTADVEQALANVPKQVYRIALFHGPIFFARSAGQYDLAFAGHSHGGQVRIPFWGPLWLPAGIGPYVHGWFAERGSRMYVSRGIGTTSLPVRFACRPELAIVTLQPAVN